MQVNLDEPPRSAAAVARRCQIIEATILTISEMGYQRASFVEIARRAGLSSTRLISYHFTDRADLMAEVAGHVVSELASAVEARVRAAASPAAALRAFIEANVEYMDGHRAQMAALTALLSAGALKVSPHHASAGIDALASIIDAGRRAGQFRPVDPAIAATIVQRAVEGVPLHLWSHPEADLTGHAQELVRFFDAALLPPTTEPSSP